MWFLPKLIDQMIFKIRSSGDVWGSPGEKRRFHGRIGLYRFFNTLFKENNFVVWEWERGKFDFDHHFAFLTIFLKKVELSAWRNIFRLVERIILKICPKRSFHSEFVKLGSEIGTLFIFGRKIVVFCLFCCNFVWFWLTFFKLKLSSSWERCF